MLLLGVVQARVFFDRREPANGWDRKREGHLFKECERAGDFDDRRLPAPRCAQSTGIR